MEILVLGGSGLVGSEFLKSSDAKGICTLAPTHRGLDIRDKDQLVSYLGKNHAPVVINGVGFTDLIAGEKERGHYSGAAWQLNVDAVQTIAEICEEDGRFLIHISTDGVFQGNETSPGPYFEDTPVIDDPTNLSWYGYTKLKGEQAIRGILDNFAIVRISHPFGNASSGRDFVRKIISYIQAGYVLFDDQKFTPTYLRDLSEVLVKIALTKTPGIFHVACGELTTPFRFAEYIAGKEGLEDKVKVGYIDDWAKENPSHYPRVKFGGLNINSTESRLGLRFHTWVEALDEFLPILP